MKFLPFYRASFLYVFPNLSFCDFLLIWGIFKLKLGKMLLKFDWERVHLPDPSKEGKKTLQRCMAQTDRVFTI